MVNGLVRLIVKILGPVIAAFLLLPAVAAAEAPVLKSVTPKGRHLLVTFSAPGAAQTVGGVTIYVARAPTRNSDGTFPAANLADEGVLTTDQIASGAWTEQIQLAPGRYWVMVAANPDTQTCTLGNATINPSCASGDSKVDTVTVPSPTRYRPSVASKHGGSVTLRLIATALGVPETLKLCYVVTVRKRASKRCSNRHLAGVDWNDSVDDLVKLSTRGMSPSESFTWSLAGRTVAHLTVKLR